MAKRAGGKIKKNRKHETDVYFIPEVAEILAQKLLPHFPLGEKRILDACANDGVLGNAFQTACLKNELDDIRSLIVSLDVVEIKNGDDILFWNEDKKYEIIVCNPPWIPVNYALAIYNKCLFLLSDNGVLFFIINNTFCYQGWSRAVKLKFQKFYFLPRYVFNWVNNKKLLDCGVMVYNRGGIPAAAAELNCYLHIPKDVHTIRMFEE